MAAGDWRSNQGDGGVTRAEKIRRTYAARPELALAVAERNRTPEARARSAEQCRRQEQWRIAQAGLDSAARKRQGAATTASRLAHIPADVRDFYLDLTRRKRLKAAEATEITLAHHEAQLARFRRSIGAE